MQRNSTLNRLLRRCVHLFYRPLVEHYLAKPRNYRFDDVTIIVRPGVFHPGMYYSSKCLLRNLSTLDLTDRRFLELGAGSGLISIIAARRGAQVTASDISTAAIDNIRQNAALNEISIDVRLSDLFEALEGQRFDVVAINPPYYSKAARTEGDFAWYCGKNLEFFRQLFGALARHLADDGIVRMVLSTDCEVDAIERIAAAEGFAMHAVARDDFLFESNIVYDVRPDPALQLVTER